MYAFEAVKSRLEKLTGLAQPTAREIKKRIKRSKPRAKRFNDNNLIPNNPALPLIHYRKVVSLRDLPDPAALFERYSRQTVGSMPGAMAFTITCITTRGLMKCSVSREDARAFVSAAKKGIHCYLAPAMSLSCRQAPGTRP